MTRRLRPAEPARCACPKARHEHGTFSMYRQHGCGCRPCKDANAARDRAARAYRRRVPMADANLARDRIARLRRAGMAMTDIAALCGVNPKTLDITVHGRKGRQPERIRAATLTALNAIRFADVIAFEIPSGRKVDGDTARRQIQALHVFGWSSSVIAVRLGINASTISHLLSGAGVLEGVRRKIDELYRELHGTEAPRATVDDRKRATRAKGRAAVSGWTADTANDAQYPVYPLIRVR
ncbi:MAG TPA: hypothetical protein VF867_11885 [Arthrobacter sp.]